MKKIALTVFACLSLSACRMEAPIPVRVERSVIYHGQTTASLFDNFGVPSKKFVDNYGIVEYHYTTQERVSNGVDNALYFCDFVVYTDEGIVIDWRYHGNFCTMADAGFLPADWDSDFLETHSSPVFAEDRPLYLD